MKLKCIDPISLGVIVILGMLLYGASEGIKKADAQTLPTGFHFSQEWRASEGATTVFDNRLPDPIIGPSLFYGTAAEYRSKVGKKVFGFLGFEGVIKGQEGVTGLVGVIPITVFDDMFKGGIYIDTQRFRIDDKDSYMLGFSAVLLQFGNKVVQ